MSCKVVGRFIEFSMEILNTEKDVYCYDAENCNANPIIIILFPTPGSVPLEAATALILFIIVSISPRC